VGDPNRGGAGGGTENAQLISAETGAHLWADQFDIFAANERARRVTIATIDGVTH